MDSIKAVGQEVPDEPASQPDRPDSCRDNACGTSRLTRGTVVTRLRDEFADLYRDEDFAALYPRRGQPVLAPWRLSLVTVLQFLEHLSDLQAADTVRLVKPLGWVRVRCSE